MINDFNSLNILYNNNLCLTKLLKKYEKDFVFIRFNRSLICKLL